VSAAGGVDGWAEFDVVGVSVGVAIVSGALSVFAASLGALTASLAVLALAGWCVLVGRAPPSIRPASIPRTGGALAAAGLGWLLFVGETGPWHSWRGLALGLSLVPLWMDARRRPLGVA
jgi:hypothetical protein